MRDARNDILAFATADAVCFFSHSSLSFWRARNARRSGFGAVAAPR
jgi:hypothetical protein